MKTPSIVVALWLAAGCEKPPLDIGSVPTCNPPCSANEQCTESGCIATDGGVDLMVPPQPDLAGACVPGCSGAAPHCRNGQCVACLTDEHCPPGQVCRPLGQTMTCQRGCSDDSRCGGGAMKCCAGQCTDTSQDVRSCGACNAVCEPPHASPSCIGGQCVAGPCEAGWGDCNQDPTDGCEANLRADTANCGGCGLTCMLPNAVQGCDNSGCFVAGCMFGFEDCNMDPKDGCETPTTSDLKNCGACGMMCPGLPHAKVACVNAGCQVSACDAGFADCDGKSINGCEITLATDRFNCGMCGNPCAQNLVCQNGACTCQQCNFPNAKSRCVNLMCVLDSCLPGYANCDGQPQNGCEISTDSDAKNCGACGNVCPMNMSFCVAAACVNAPVNPFFNSMPKQTGQTARGAGNPCGTQATALQNQTLFAIAINISIAAPTNIKFMIWSHPGHQLLFITPPKLFQPGSGWMQSDPFAPFMLQAGLNYDFGGTADQAATYYYDQVVENQNGMASLSLNPNWNTYAMPVHEGHVLAAISDCGVELF